MQDASDELDKLNGSWQRDMVLQVAHAKKQAQTDHQIELEACNKLIAFLILYR